MGVCIQQNSDRRVRGFVTAYGNVSTTRGSFRFMEKSIVKLPFYHRVFVVLRIV